MSGAGRPPLRLSDGNYLVYANPALNLELISKATLKRIKIIMNCVYFYGERERQKFAYIVKTSKRHADQ